MPDQLIVDLICSPSAEVTERLFHDSESVFWVGWRADDAEIAGDCEAILQTGTLRSSWDDELLMLSYQGVQRRVPITESPDDRHITLLAINEMLAPVYEVRLAWASNPPVSG